MTGKTSGKDPKTLGGSAIKDIFSQIEKKEFKAWRKEANY
jgi:Fe-S cluster biosynthesis and repair protein YggX